MRFMVLFGILYDHKYTIAVHVFLPLLIWLDGIISTGILFEMKLCAHQPGFVTIFGKAKMSPKPYFVQFLARG